MRSLRSQIVAIPSKMLPLDWVSARSPYTTGKRSIINQRGNVNYVKKMLFPLEMLPGVSPVVCLTAYLILFGVPHITVLLLPLVFLPFLLFIMGLTWALASPGVYLRDISQFIGVATMALMFLSPIFYAASALPEEYRRLLLLNPLTPVTEQVRDVLFWGKVPDMTIWFAYLLGSVLVAFSGFVWFQKTRKGFGDVL
jgi:lipopolysaccharide transport system permease protein